MAENEAPRRIWLADCDEGGWRDKHRLGHTFAFFTAPSGRPNEWTGVEYVRADCVERFRARLLESAKNLEPYPDEDGQSVVVDLIEHFPIEEKQQ